MGIEVKDINDGIGAIIIGTDEINSDDFINALRIHLTQDEEKFKKYRYFISDYTAITEMDISTIAINTVAHLSIEASKINPNIVTAVIAERDIIFGLSRMAIALKDKSNWEKQVFRNKEDALLFIKDRVKEVSDIKDLTW